MYVLTYVRAYVRACVHTLVRTYVRTYVRPYARTCIHTHVPSRTYARTHVSAYVRTCARASSRTYVRAYVLRRCLDKLQIDLDCKSRSRARMQTQDMLYSSLAYSHQLLAQSIGPPPSVHPFASNKQARRVPVSTQPLLFFRWGAMSWRGVDGCEWGCGLQACGKLKTFVEEQGFQQELLEEVQTIRPCVVHSRFLAEGQSSPTPQLLLVGNEKQVRVVCVLSVWRQTNQWRGKAQGKKGNAKSFLSAQPVQVNWVSAVRVMTLTWKRPTNHTIVAVGDSKSHNNLWISLHQSDAFRPDHFYHPSYDSCI